MQKSKVRRKDGVQKTEVRKNLVRDGETHLVIGYHSLLTPDH